jgi:hypothetical protein
MKWKVDALGKSALHDDTVMFEPVVIFPCLALFIWSWGFEYKYDMFVSLM